MPRTHLTLFSLRSLTASGVIAVVLGLTLSLVSAPGAAAENGRRLEGAGRVAQTWAPLFMSNDHVYTEAEAVRVAKRFDMLVAMPWNLKKHVAAMKRANPDLQILTYANATLGLEKDVKSLPWRSFLRTRDGNKIKANGFGTYLMRPDDGDWRRVATSQCRDRAQSAGYDGCLMDMLTLGIFAKGFLDGEPINPWTKQPYTPEQYRNQMIALARDLRDRTPGLVHVGNMVENSYRYWHSAVTSAPLVYSAPGAQMEDFLRGANDARDRFPSTSKWLENVRIITDLEARNKSALFTTKLWSGASESLAARWHAYSMATFLMGANGSSYFAFTQARGKDGASHTNTRYAMPRGIGAPVKDMRKTWQGGYVRIFERGVVVANPTDKPVTISIGRVLRMLNGNTVQGSVTLPPNTGDVMVETGVPAV